MFSSQVPLSSFFKENLKFIDEHHKFVRHCRLHDNKVGESNLLATNPMSSLFSCVLIYDEREFKSEFPLAINVVDFRKRKNNITLLYAIEKEASTYSNGKKVFLNCLTPSNKILIVFFFQQCLEMITTWPTKFIHRYEIGVAAGVLDNLRATDVSQITCIAYP